MHKHNRPKWWLVYGWLIAMGVLFIWQDQLPLSPGWRQVALGAIVVLTYAVLLRWVWNSEEALEQTAQEQEELDAMSATSPQVPLLQPTPIQQHFRQVVMGINTTEETNPS
jgi:hypothetical protein